jgi:hypothetical protein
MKENRDFKGVWIPKEVWLNKNLSIIEKCLLVEIDSLDNSERGCFASNEYLANFFKLSESRMANIISDLKKRGFINQIFFDGRQRGLRIIKSEVWFTENDKADISKTVKLPYRKREHNNTLNKTNNNTTDISFENEFSHFEKIIINENEYKESSKVNPFTIVSLVEKEKEKNTRKKEKADAEPKPERKPNPTYESFTVFCQTFEQLSGAAYPTDQRGNYIMSPKDAGGMVYLLRWIEKVDRSGNVNEALKVFLNAAWGLNDKWIKANFTPAILYSQSAKIYTAYQTSSPAAKEKAYNDEVDRLLAEAMKKYQTQ